LPHLAPLGYFSFSGPLISLALHLPARYNGFVGPEDLCLCPFRAQARITIMVFDNAQPAAQPLSGRRRMLEQVIANEHFTRKSLKGRILLGISPYLYENEEF
jgi:hypothetical protein